MSYAIIRNVNYKNKIQRAYINITKEKIQTIQIKKCNTTYTNVLKILQKNITYKVELTRKTSLILAQNNELIKTNKLKRHLAKLYKAIEKVHELEEENIFLKHENENLKQENFKLRIILIKLLKNNKKDRILYNNKIFNILSFFNSDI